MAPRRLPHVVIPPKGWTQTSIKGSFAGGKGWLFDNPGLLGESTQRLVGGAGLSPGALSRARVAPG